LILTGGAGRQRTDRTASFADRQLGWPDPGGEPNCSVIIGKGKEFASRASQLRVEKVHSCHRKAVGRKEDRIEAQERDRRALIYQIAGEV